jgi:hypothetical protein
LKRSICTRPSSPARAAGAIQARPPLLLHLALQGLLDLQLGARPQPFGRQLGGAMAEAVGDVVARDDEVFAGVVAPAHDQVGVRVVGVPVIDRHPIQPRAQVGFHAAHQVPGVGAQVVQLGAILGRDDEAEMVPVVGAAFLEGVEVGFVGLRPVGSARLAVAAHAVALDVAQVLGERLRAGPLLVDQQVLMVTRRDMGVSFAPAKRAAVWPRPRREPGRWPVLAAASRCRTAHRRLAAAGLAGLLEHLGNEALAPVLRGAGAHAEIVIAAVGHGCSLQAPACPVVRSTRTCLHRRGPRAPAARRRSRVPRHPTCRLAFDAARCRVLCLAFRLCLRCPLPATAARRRCCTSSQRAGEHGDGRRPGAFEARRLHVGRLRRRQREVRRGCARTARATTRQQQQNDTPDGTMMRSESAAIMGALQPDRMRNADHGGCADRPEIAAVERRRIGHAQQEQFARFEGGGKAARMAAAGPAGRQAARRPKARRRCEPAGDDAHVLRRDRAHTFEQRNARRQVAALRSQRGSLGRQRHQHDAVHGQRTWRERCGSNGSMRYQPTATLSDGL